MNRCKNRRINTVETPLNFMDDRNDESERWMCQQIKSVGQRASIKLLVSQSCIIGGRNDVGLKKTLREYRDEYQQNIGGGNGKNKPKTLIEIKATAKGIVNNITDSMLDPADRFEICHGNKTLSGLQQLVS